jgi:carbon-monoxide dehydrogenase large subunit
MSGSILGRAVRRVEDPELLTGAVRFVDDLPVEDGLYAVFVRSTMPHGRITGVDTAEAHRMPGVVGVFVAADLELPDRHDVEEVPAVGAHLLEAAFDDMVLLDGGKLGVAGAPDTALPLGAIAEAAADPSRLPEGIEPGLAATADFRMDGNTFPLGTHVSVVEVDAETGLVRPVRHVAVDDCGRILNPMLVDGQAHGGIGQGLAQGLYEEALYDEDANPLTASLMSYAMPGPPDVPPIEAAHTETDTPLNPLGAKGIGESATVGSTPAVQNAVIDALSHLGVRHVDMPCTPERVWRAIREAKG